MEEWACGPTATTYGTILMTGSSLYNYSRVNRLEWCYGLDRSGMDEN